MGVPTLDGITLPRSFQAAALSYPDLAADSETVDTSTKMPPKEKKERTTNFRSWEVQARLLAALVASLDNHRFDYKSKLVRSASVSSYSSTSFLPPLAPSCPLLTWGQRLRFTCGDYNYAVTMCWQERQETAAATVLVSKLSMALSDLHRNRPALWRQRDRVRHGAPFPRPEVPGRVPPGLGEEGRGSGALPGVRFQEQGG